MVWLLGAALAASFAGGAAGADDVFAALPLTGAGPVGGYTPPPLTDNLFLAYGDSRTANSAANPYGSPTFAPTWGYSNGYAGWLNALGGGKLLAGVDWNYGVGSQSSAGIAGRATAPGHDCNNNSSINTSTGAVNTPSCFTGSVVKPSVAVSAGATSVSVTLASGAAPAGGEYINWPNAAGNYACTVGTVTGAGPYSFNIVPPAGSALTAAQCVTGAINTSTYFVISPPSVSSSFAAYLGASGAGATITDVSKSIMTTGAASPASDTPKVVYELNGVNDGNLTLTAAQPQALIDIAASLDAFKPAAANKIVILADEEPIGLATGYSVANATPNGSPEVCTINASNQCTLTQAANYYDTVQVVYAPAGSGPPFVSGAGDGTQLINCTSGVAAATNGAAACTPGAGQYSVSAGVLNFNAADTGKAVAVYYRWKNNATTSGFSYFKIIHDWLRSANADFVDNGVDYGVPGALYNRPWVKLASTWDAVVDAASGTNFYPLPYASVDGLHPAPAGGAAVANAMLNAASAAGAVKASVPYPSPSLNNPYLSSLTVSTVTTGQTTTPNCAGQPNAANRAYWATATTPAVSTGVYGPNGPLASPALLLLNSTTNVSANTHVICIDSAATLPGLLMDAPAILTGVSTGMLQLDGAGIVANGVPDHVNELGAAPVCGASNANCMSVAYNGQSFTPGLSANWTLSLDANSTAAINAGTLGLGLAVANAPFAGDASDWQAVQLSGYVSNAGNLSIGFALSANGMARALLNPGDSYRGLCDVRLGAGKNGHLYGLSSASVKASIQTSAANWAPPGTSSATYSVWSGVGGAGSMAFSDGLIQPGAPGTSGSASINGLSSGVLALRQISPPATYVSGTLSGSTPQLALTLTANKGDPISATVWFGHCQLRKATQ